MTLRDLLNDHGIRLQNYAVGGHKSLCPKCSHTRKNKTDLCLSVTIEPDAAVWNCHNCRWASSVSDRTEEPVPMRHRRRPIVKPDHKPSGLSPKVVAWFATRAIPEPVLVRNGIGVEETWMPGCKDGEKINAITFPYRRDGETVNVKYRTHDKRFRQVKDAEKIYYGLNDIAESDTVIICEGEIDKLSLEVAGFLNAVSVPDGAPAQVKDAEPDPEDDRKFEYVWNCKDQFEGKGKIILAVDADAPGQALAEELARRYGKHRCWIVSWPTQGDVTAKDANEVLVHHGAEVLREVIANARPYPIRGIHSAAVYFDNVMRAYDGQDEPLFSTGFSNIDRLVKVRAGDFWVWTGQPGSGKSQLVDALNVYLARTYGWRFALCSFENPPIKHIQKLLALYSGAPFRPGWRERMSREDVAKGLAWVQDHFTFIRAEDEGPTIDWILEKAKVCVMRDGINSLVIDPYNEIEHRRAKNLTETEYVSELIGKVKRFAEEHQVHVSFVAHPAKPQRLKNGDIPSPSLYDISGSANWANKADVGVVVVRKYDREQYSPPQFGCEVHVKKVRWSEVGIAGQTELDYDRATGRYSEASASTFRSAANE